MTALIQMIARTAGTRITADALSADLIIGGLMVLITLGTAATYGLDLSWAFF